MPQGKPEPTLIQSNPRATLYLLPIVLVPLLLIASAFFIIPTHWFVARADSPYLANFGYAESLHNHSCEVLVYGDSTAMVGVNPLQLARETGLSACNIAEFEGMTLVSNTLLVDDFLAHNPRPRFLIFLFAPEDLQRPASWKTVSTFEATSFMVHEHPGLSTALLLAKHPVNTFGWAEQGLRMAVQRLPSHPISEDKFHLRDGTLGQLPMTAKTLTACDDERRQAPPDAAWITHLRQQYGIDGTRVFIDETPIPPCDASRDYDLQQLAGVTDSLTNQIIPVTSFTTDGRLHVNADGAARITALLSGQINAARANESHSERAR